MNEQEMNEIAQKLSISQTFVSLAQMSEGMPIDVNVREELAAGLSACLLQMILALDNDRITFKDEDDHAMFVGMLTVVADYIYGGNGNLASCVETVRLN